MDGTERIIGELKEFKRVTIKELDTIKQDIRALQNFKWRVVGGAMVIAGLVSGAFELIHLMK